MTPAYQGDVQQTIDILQAVLATEIVCVLRYTMNAVAATGISSDSVKEEFDQHAKEEQEPHARGGRADQSAGRNAEFQSRGAGVAIGFAVRGGREP